MYNVLTDTDSYKYSHFLQYPPDTTHISSYIAARRAETVFFGLQALLLEHWSRPITHADVDEAMTLVGHGLPLNEAGFRRIVDEHNGYLPLRVEALPEGTVAPAGTPLVQVVNTDPAMPWVTSFAETALLRIWYPTSVATRSFRARQIIHQAFEMTSDAPISEELLKLHDFGARGASSEESARIGGCAHLTCFRGTDTVPALLHARRYYAERMAGYSIPAAEHSTITSWGREGETEACRNMLLQFGGPGRILAVVSDSYDLFSAVRNIWGGALKAEVQNSGGTVVIRPDSGDPAVVPVETVQLLGEIFGTTINGKGYRVLDPCVRVVQGDGIDVEMIRIILRNLAAHGYSAENIAFGMGGALLQRVDRDTFGFAMKASARRDSKGNWHDVYKDPVTDPGKRSLRGRLAVVEENGQFLTVRQEALFGRRNLLRPVWECGKLLERDSFTGIRQRIDFALAGPGRQNPGSQPAERASGSDPGHLAQGAPLLREIRYRAELCSTAHAMA